MRVFGSDRFSGMMAKLGLKDGQPIEHKIISKAVENAQRKVEAHNFDMRKHLLEYDDVMNKQREVIYTMRKDILTGDDQKEMVHEFVEEVIEEKLAEVCHEKIYPEEWDVDQLRDYFDRTLMISIEKKDDKHIQVEGQPALELEHCNAEKLRESIHKQAIEHYDHKRLNSIPYLKQ